MGCLFAAIGGFCKAFEQAGAKVLWANEKDQFVRVPNFCTPLVSREDWDAV